MGSYSGLFVFFHLFLYFSSLRQQKNDSLEHRRKSALEAEVCMLKYTRLHHTSSRTRSQHILACTHSQLRCMRNTLLHHTNPHSTFLHAYAYTLGVEVCMRNIHAYITLAHAHAHTHTACTHTLRAEVCMDAHTSKKQHAKSRTSTLALFFKVTWFCF